MCFYTKSIILGNIAYLIIVAEIISNPYIKLKKRHLTALYWKLWSTGKTWINPLILLAYIIEFRVLVAKSYPTISFAVHNTSVPSSRIQIASLLRHVQVVSIGWPCDVIKSLSRYDNAAMFWTHVQEEAWSQITLPVSPSFLHAFPEVPQALPSRRLARSSGLLCHHVCLPYEWAIYFPSAKLIVWVAGDHIAKQDSSMASVSCLHTFRKNG